MAPDFIPGLDLCGRFYRDAVRPSLDAAFPALRYAAALICEGSDVLGLDTPMSMDHGWGPRLYLFLDDADSRQLGETIDAALERELPEEFLGFPTRYETYAGETAHCAETDAASPIPRVRHAGRRHGVTVTTVRRLLAGYLGLDIDAPMALADWLTLPEQKLLGITAGAVYHDEIGLREVRSRFAYYPRDVWLYQLASDWNRIGQEEHLMGRAGFTGDELGSAIIASRLARDVMRLCFRIERRYAPYPKWFGAAFRNLPCGPQLEPFLLRAVTSARWEEREEALCSAYGIAAEMQNATGIAAEQPADIVQFFNRPFRVMHLGANFAEIIAARIEDPWLNNEAKRALVGGIDNVSDNTDILCRAEFRTKIRAIY